MNYPPACPVCGESVAAYKGPCPKEPAMTTAAPPEKMMLEPCPFCGGPATLHLHPGIFGDGEHGHRVECDDCNAMTWYQPSAKEAMEAWNLREAARRLAPRVGDDGLVERIEYLISPYLHPMTAVETRHAVAEEIAALSAPPAASAEREELIRALDAHECWVPPAELHGKIDMLDISKRQTEDLTDYLLALGYRKRAAQGVDLLKRARAYIVSLDRCSSLEYEIDDFLSALPKGQEHEG